MYDYTNAAVQCVLPIRSQAVPGQHSGCITPGFVIVLLAWGLPPMANVCSVALPGKAKQEHTTVFEYMHKDIHNTYLNTT